jgi:hypothetical protein
MPTQAATTSRPLRPIDAACLSASVSHGQTQMESRRRRSAELRRRWWKGLAVSLDLRAGEIPLRSDLVALEMGLLALGSHIVLSTTLVRLLPARAPVLLHMASAAGMAAVLALAVMVFSRGNAQPFWIAVSMLYGGAVAFLFAFSAVYKSISLEVLCALSRAPRHRLDLGTISRDLVLPRFVERIELLITAGLVSSTTDGYSLTVPGRDAARRLRALQRFAGIRRSGLYGDEGSS